MLAIKLKRIGKKHQPSYRIIVAEKRSKIEGRNVEDLGWLNPLNKEFNINKDRANYWLKIGAQPTDTVHNLFVKSGILTGPKKPKGKYKKAEEPVSVQAQAVNAEVQNENTEMQADNNSKVE